MTCAISMFKNECKHMTLVINMLNNIFPCIQKCKIIISSIPICYAKCHYVIVFHFKKLLVLTNSIILAMTMRDTLNLIGI